MNTSSPQPGDWDEKIPGDETFEDVKRRLSAELQRAAANLIDHLNTTSFRIRMAVGAQQFYITIGGGRHTDDMPVDDGNDVGKCLEVAMVEAAQQDSGLALRHAGRKKVPLVLTSNLEK